MYIAAHPYEEMHQHLKEEKAERGIAKNGRWDRQKIHMAQRDREPRGRGPKNLPVTEPELGIQEMLSIIFNILTYIKSNANGGMGGGEVHNY